MKPKINLRKGLDKCRWGVKSLRYYLMFGRKENKMEQEVKKHEGFGVASLVLSIIALVFSAIALPAWVFMFWLDYLALPLAVLGLIFGIIGRVKNKDGKSLAGIIMSSIALAFSVIVLVVVYVILLGAAAAL